MPEQPSPAKFEREHCRVSQTASTGEWWIVQDFGPSGPPIELPVKGPFKTKEEAEALLCMVEDGDAD